MKKLFTTLIALLAVAISLQAQDVYISPTTGHLIAAVTGDNETGFENGFSSLWRHNQLGLTMVVADEVALTDGKELANPAGNLSVVNGKLVLTGGQPSDCFLVVSLPRGYRFTSYTIVLNNDMNNHSFQRNFSTGRVSKTFYETDETFTNYKANSGVMPATNDNKDYTVANTVSGDVNRLYFRLHKNYTGNDRYYGVSIKSFIVHFAADASFNQQLNALPTASAVGVEKASFLVGKPELGTIKPNTKNGKTYFSYDYKNVSDMKAENLLYQSNAVVAGKADDSGLASTKTITRTIYNGQGWFALKKGTDPGDNTYYVETPITLTTAGGYTDIPTGYRITGATFEFSRGAATSGGNTVGVDQHGEITYLQSNGSLVKDKPTTGWTIDRNRDLKIDDTQIYLVRNNGEYFLTPTPGYYDNVISANFYVDEENYLYATFTTGRWFQTTTTLYLHEGTAAGEQGVMTTTKDATAAKLFPYSGITPSSEFTATIFDKEGKTVAETATINASNPNQTLSVSGFNNDAVKFKIDGLDDNSQALVRITLTMQHLNPYISTIDIIGRDIDNTNQDPISQTFSASNFSVRGGHFEFFVPKGTSDNRWQFEFDNLRSNYTDNTYPGEKGGNARIAFVNSDYFKANTTGDLTKQPNLYDTDPNAASDTKLSVKEVGQVPFRFNNADELSNESDTKIENNLKEYPFTLKKYLSDGWDDKDGTHHVGSFGPVILSATGTQENHEKIAYIAVSDETQYNIAPTTATEHRYYAHYELDIEVLAKEYTPKVSIEKVYDQTLYTDASEKIITKPMYGVKVTAVDENGTEMAAGSGSLTMNQIRSAIEAKLTDESNTTDLKSEDQILYLDLSSLNGITLSTGNFTTDQINLYLDSVRADYAPNCLVFMPVNSKNAVNNYVSKNATGTSVFNSNANIVLVDRYPFFAPYDIQTGANYAKYTRKMSHSSNGKANISTLVLPFAFTIDSNGTHTNVKANNATDTGDGKSFALYKLADKNAISPDKGDTKLDGFDENLVRYNNNVHFVPAQADNNKKSKAYAPYLVYSYNYNNDNNEFANEDENFTVLEYNTTIERTAPNTVTDKTTQACGNVKNSYEGNTSSGNLDGTNYQLYPTYTMAGYQIPIASEYGLYFASNRFRSSWTLQGSNTVKMLPFRFWYDCGNNKPTKAKDLYYGIAFGFGDETTGIDEINADNAEKTGTYKFIHNGQLLIHTDNGVFTVDGRKVNL